MDIEKQIKRIKEYFVTMKVENFDGEQVIYVITKFPNRWIISNDLEQKFGVVAQEYDRDGQWVFVAPLEIGFDGIFSAIEYNIEQMKSAQERATLLQKKVTELREVFEDETMTLDMLRSLDFTWKGKKKTSPTKTKKQEEKTEEETEDGTDA